MTTINITTHSTGQVGSPMMVGEGEGEEPPPEDEEGDFFDPADYTVPEVVEYAETYPDQLEDIITAERAGKNRSTLISQLEDLRV